MRRLLRVRGPIAAASQRLQPLALVDGRPQRQLRFTPLTAQRLVSSASLATMASLVVVNSLRPGAPVPFKPKQEGKVSWYACGPTVYDQSHLGHARNYVSTDILRRIMLHYFGFNVHFVMNITDIDDKIIIRARRKRLFETEKKKGYSADQSRKLVADAFLAYAESSLPLLLQGDGPLNEDNYKERKETGYGRVLAGGTLDGEGKASDAEAKAKMHLANTDSAAAVLQAASSSPDALLDGAEEVLLPYLDSLYKETIDTSDQTMFTDLTRAVEADFTADMDALNVLRPDEVTRVTEYVPQIADFVARIVDKGFAYEADGSVYFDIAAFERAGNTYARLRPESKNDKALQEEGEGALSKGAGGKKSPGDFALWKKSKPGEPYWPSRWGNGRPGWHIECSVMASDKMGEQMDVHSGGVDLKFPHHDNELAQSEAYYCQHGKGEHEWVRYFFHMGHLSIAGSKMSKSLKNFQTINDALATTYTARSMRIVFLMGKWYDGVEISPDLRKQADNWETTIDNFFTNVKSKLAAGGTATGALDGLSLTGDSPAEGLASELEQADRDVEKALLNSFDTPTAMQVILKLVRDANIYMNDRSNAPLAPVEKVAAFVTRLVGILGLDRHAQPPYKGLGWASAGAGTALDPKQAVEPYAAVFARVSQDVRALGVDDAAVESLLSHSPQPEFLALEEAGERDPEKLALPYVRAVSQLRDELRRLASAAPPPESKKALLALSDRIRDYDLTDLGVQLDDQADRPSLVKFVPAARLVAAREEKAALAAERVRQKEEARLAKARAEADKWEKAKVPPGELFRGDARYAEWDADGVPTRLADGGGEVPKSQVKKLRKDWERQKKAHDEWLARGGAGAGPSGS